MKMSSMESPSASHQRVDEPHIETTEFAWKPLYKVGGHEGLRSPRRGVNEVVKPCGAGDGSSIH